MPATTGYQAGIATNDTSISYGVETVWGTLPAVQFQALRITSETLSGTKTRQRPTEINSTRESTASVTTQEAAGGDINFALSYGTYDDFLSVVLGNDWQTLQSIAGIAGDITLTNLTASSATLSSTLSTKYANISVGQWIRLLGFTNATNNGFFRVTAKASNQSLTVATPGGATVTETPTGTLAQVRASTIMNGIQFKSLYLQNKFSSSMFLRYPGCFVTVTSLTGGVGQFLSGRVSVLAQQELKATIDASTGAVLAAPSGRIHDPVGGFYGVLWNNALVAATVDSFTVTMTNTGAASQYGMGSASAAGMLPGTMEVTGTVRMYFKDFTYYDIFKAETLGSLSFITRDPAGQAYAITVASATLMNPKIDAGGPGQSVMASFDVEGNPQSGGGTIILDRLAAS
jgi:hypothetical protein